MSYSKLHDQDHPIIAKTGLAANINATATKNQATEGELHYTTDNDQLYVFDGSNNERVHGLDMAMVNLNGDIITKGGEIIYG